MFHKKDTFLYRNYADFRPLDIKCKTKSKEKLTIVYAGLLGVAQGIYKLVQHLDYTGIEFHIYGDHNCDRHRPDEKRG